MDVRVGLDFGTHQTKVCTNYKKRNNPQVFEFINFGTADNIDLFLPSQVNVHKDESVSIGNSVQDSAKSYKYFKIASAEDKEFKGVSGFEESEELYELDRYDGLTPEFLSIIYLAKVIGYTEHKFKSKHQKEKQVVKKKSFMGRFFGGNKKDKNETESRSFTFYYQIGIPTEWSAQKNRWRRRKFEQILYLAKDIVDRHSHEKLKELGLVEFQSVVDIHYQSLQNDLHKYTWNDLLDKYRISAFPETAAGLTYLVKTEKIGEGYYLALDIGGGSSDISFFRVNANKTFEYLASESLMIASNNLYDKYYQHSDNLNSTEEAQNYLDSVDSQYLENDEKYKRAFEHTIKALNDKIKHIYNERVYFRFKEAIANLKFKDQSCFLYGGGSLLHTPERNLSKLLEEILLHDQGTQSLTMPRTKAKIEKITELDLIQKIKPEGWKEYLPLLIVPLGLSFIQPDQTYDWNDQFYEPGEGYYDINEDPELFDIFKRRWI